MSNNTLRAMAMLSMLAVAGCAAESRKPPVSTAGNDAGPASSMPQPINSLPLGSATSAPLAPASGDVATTRVGPATTGAARRGAATQR